MRWQFIHHDKHTQIHTVAEDCLVSQPWYLTDWLSVATSQFIWRVIAHLITEPTLNKTRERDFRITLLPLTYSSVLYYKFPVALCGRRTVSNRPPIYENLNDSSGNNSKTVRWFARRPQEKLSYPLVAGSRSTETSSSHHAQSQGNIMESKAEYPSFTPSPWLRPLLSFAFVSLHGIYSLPSACLSFPLFPWLVRITCIIFFRHAP